jgi:hypothetical protein
MLPKNSLLFSGCVRLRSMKDRLSWIELKVYQKSYPILRLEKQLKVAAAKRREELVVAMMTSGPGVIQH